MRTFDEFGCLDDALIFKNPNTVLYLCSRLRKRAHFEAAEPEYAKPIAIFCTCIKNWRYMLQSHPHFRSVYAFAARCFPYGITVQRHFTYSTWNAIIYNLEWTVPSCWE